MKFRQVLTLSLTALLMSVLLTVPAFAATDPSSADFLDIPSDSACYEAVAYLADRGITMGTGDQCFSPEELITVRQWAAMLDRAYQADAAEVYWRRLCSALLPGRLADRDRAGSARFPDVPQRPFGKRLPRGRSPDL